MIWALEYAVTRAHSDTSILYGAEGGAREFPFCYFVVRDGDRVVMVDCGFDDNAYTRGLMADLGISDFQPLDVVLARIGLAPSDVTDVVLTHHHFDHAGAVEMLPSATVWIQEREVEDWTVKWTASPRLEWLRAGLDPDTGPTLARLRAAGRLRLVDGAAQVTPRVAVRPAFTSHTEGSQYVVLTGADGRPWVVAGDVAYVYENLGGLDGTQPLVPIGRVQGSVERCLRVTEEMLELVGENVSRVLPMHEARLWDQFPATRHDDGLHVAEIEKC
ncbi:N-acyl homoserine lactonase family protein [Pseudonocardia halophobica]|uniref:Hydrolase glyoxylase n=1 Tax=Pseudonocardia halophobica TaxID=29401 RepID=A0A9W6L7U8_9PSEU|nr:N-acyl homoserine lactonase family protein [Pseudonocardia halophobica]GLL14490.1 hydrolase glyoxylase [Pseudonocardia halophobica]